MGFFAWVRHQVGSAVVAGFEDGLRQVDESAEAADAQGEPLRFLRVEIAPGLPAAEPSNARRKRKAKSE